MEPELISDDMSARILQDRKRLLDQSAITFMEGVADPARVARDRQAMTHPQASPPGSGANLASAPGKVAGDVAGGIAELPSQVIGGARDAAAGALGGVAAFDQWASDKLGLPKLQLLNDQGAFDLKVLAPDQTKKADVILPEVKGATTVTGGLIRGVSQFLTGYATGGKLLGAAGKISTASRVARAAGKSMFSDFAAFDGHEERLSNLIQSVPALQNPVSEYLASNMSDSELAGRLKNVAEGVLSDAVLAGLVSGIRGIRQARKARAEVGGETYAEAARRLASDPKALPPRLPDVTGVRGPDAPIAVKKADLATLADETRAWLDQVDTGAKGADAAPDPAAGLAVSKIDAGQGGVYINWSRIETPDDVKAAVQAVADADKAGVDAARRGVRSNAATALDADHENAWKLLLDRREGDTMNAEKTLALRRLWAASGEKLVAAARLVESAPTPQNTFLFRRALALHGTIQREVIAVRTETARALQQWSIPAGSNDAVARQIGDTVTMFGGEDVASDLAGRIVGLADGGNFAAIDAVSRKGALAATRDAVFEYWVNGILSNPTTHLVNIQSNAGVALLSIAERHAAAGLPGGRAVVDGVDAGEAAAMLSGAWAALPDAWRFAREAFKTGKTGFGLQKLETPRTRSISSEALANTRNEAFNRAMNQPLVALGINSLGAVMSLPGRALGAADEFFKTISYRMEVHARAARQAQHELRAGVIGPEDVKRRMAELASDPPEDVAAAAREFAAYNTFTNDAGKLAKWINDGRSKFPLLRYVVPFVNTPANILRFAAERSPIAAAMPGVLADIRAGGARQQLALARMGIGSFIMWTGLDYALNGKITGGGPSSPSERANLRRTGWQPYSVKIGDRFYSYNRVDPFGAQLGVVANLAETALNSNIDPGENLDEVIYGAIGATAQQLTDKTYFRGPAELFQMMSDPKRYAPSYFEKFASSFVPFSAATNQAKNVVDPTFRRTSDTLERIRSRIPGLSADLPPRHDLWGREISFQSGLGPVYDAVSPIYSSKLRPEPIDEALQAVGYFPGMPSMSVTRDGERFSLRNEPQIYERFMVLQGATPANDLPPILKADGKPSAASKRLKTYGSQTLLETLNSVVQGAAGDLSVEYAASDEDGRVRIIKRIIGDYRQHARARLIGEYSDFFQPGQGTR